MDYAETTRWLFALKNRGTKFGIDRMRLLSAALGNPEKTFPSILIAGSNGKGSTAAMLEAIFRANGYSTGLYTSPHLVRLGERVQVNRVPLADEVICHYVEKIKPFAQLVSGGDPDEHPSFFEFMTAMAFLEFHEKCVGMAVVEVGLGGRLDATNVLRPWASVITSISLEHTEILGDTIEKIAAEKGGIIKPDIPVILGLVPVAAEKVLRKISRAKGASVFSVRERFENDENLFPATNLAGAHQRANAALALLTAEVLQMRFPFDEDTARAALRNVDWAGRWQEFSLSRGRRLIIDVAHNAEGAAVIEPLLEQLRKETGRAPIIITGVLGVDRAVPLLQVFLRHAKSLHLVQPEQERACPVEALRALVPSSYVGSVTPELVPSLFPAPGECVLGDEGDILVVAGSVYLAGEVLARFLPGVATSENFLQDNITPPKKVLGKRK